MSDTPITSGRELTSENVCYYSTLTAYAIDLIATKCENIRYSNNPKDPEYYRQPLSSTAGLNDQYYTTSDSYTYTVTNVRYNVNTGFSGHKKITSKGILYMNVGPKYDSYTGDELIFEHAIKPKNPPILQTVDLSTLQSELYEFLTSVGIVSKAGAVMTTKSILNMFSYIAEFITSKVIIYQNQDNKTAYTYYCPGRRTSSYNTKFLDDDGSGRLLTTDENDSIDNMFKAFSNLDGINPNILIVKYSCSSSSSSCSCSCSSCSCSSSSSSSCSSSSSSYIVYMLIE